MKTYMYGLLLTGALGCAGETPALVPVSPVQRAAGDHAYAVAESGGVVFRLERGSWHGQPRELERMLTPVRVSVRNQGAAGVQLGPDRFRLVGASGRVYTALVAPGAWDAFSESHGLPTVDMLRAGLPRTTLASGGVASGYLYFPRVRGHEPWVTLEVSLDRAEGEGARATVPLEVH